MAESERTEALLSEIRDLQKEHLAEYRRHVARQLELSSNAVATQDAMQRFYKRVVFAGAVILVGLFALLWSLLSS